MNVDSFNLDHTKVKAPYIRLCSVFTSRKGDKIYKYDLRFKQPNKEFITIKVMHSLEHLLADYIRNHLNNVLDLSPMGCQTGFYLIILGKNSLNEVADALKTTLLDIISAKKIPATNKIQCGRANSHNLEGAKIVARSMLNSYDRWLTVF